MSTRTPVRARTLKRLKYLSAVSAASIGAACNNGGGYGVVDPLPEPACTDDARPIVTARYITADGGASDAGDGSRLVEITIGFDKPTENTFAAPTSVDVTIVESMLAATVGGRIVVRATATVTHATLTVPISCPKVRASRLDIRLSFGATNVTAFTN